MLKVRSLQKQTHKMMRCLEVMHYHHSYLSNMLIKTNFIGQTFFV